MTRMNNTYNIPAGMQDWLPGEASKKRSLINLLLENIARWGYEEVGTPVLEYFHVLNELEEGLGGDDLYKLIDRDGSILAMRSEMTVPIARVISSKLSKHFPQRLMYGAEVFRYEDVQAGRLREFNQVGVELVGEKSAAADSEVLALVVDSLKKAGLENFTVSLGHMGVLRGLLEYLSLDENEQAAVRKLILDKDFAGLEQLLEKTAVDKKKQNMLLNLLTKPLTKKELEAEITDKPEIIKAALLELKENLDILDQYGICSHIQVDLSTLRSQGYYTGIVFEVYTSGIGYPIGGGGRYDTLLKRFGMDLPATGFALGVERLMMSLPESEGKEETIILVSEEPKINSQAIIKKAKSLREEGNKVIVDLRKLDIAEHKRIAEQKCAKVYWLVGDENNE